MLARELELLKSAAIEAAALAFDYQKRNFEKWDKPNEQGPVTEADLAVNDLLIQKLQKDFSDCSILSEEIEESHQHYHLGRALVIDPIDGTKAFINQEPYFAVSLALIENGTPKAGVIAAPALGDIYTAHENGGAFCNDQPIKISSQNALPEATLLASKAKYNRTALEMEPKLQTAFRPSIALRLALVAKGDFDLNVALRPSWDWDIAAGDCLIREAGGICQNRLGQAPKYGNIPPQQNGIVAGSQHLVKEFLKRIK